MTRTRTFTALIIATVLSMTLSVSGCHSNAPQGVYTDSTGHISLEFKDNKAFLNLGGMADPDGTPYDVNGDQITIHYAPDGMLAGYSKMTILSDGSLQSQMGTFKKK
jgi:hypothetical protein